MDSVGSASLRSFYNQPSNQPGAQWYKPAAPKPAAAGDIADSIAMFMFCLGGLNPLCMSGCSESGNDKLVPPQKPTPDGGAPADNPDSGPIDTGTTIINIPVGNTLPDAGPKLDAAPVKPDLPVVVIPSDEPDAGFIPGVDAQDPIDTNYVIPLPPPDGPTVVPSIDTGATSNQPIDADPLTNIPAKVLVFSEHAFEIKLTGNAAAVQEAINPKPVTITNTQGKLDCSANTQYYLVFWTQGNKVTDTSGIELEKYFPNICKDGILNVARQSDIDPKFTNETGYPYGFLFTPDENPRPPIVLTQAELNGSAVMTPRRKGDSPRRAKRTPRRAIAFGPHRVCIRDSGLLRRRPDRPSRRHHLNWPKSRCLADTIRQAGCFRHAPATDARRSGWVGS